MGLKSKFSVLYAKFSIARQKKWMSNPIKTSEKDFEKLIKKGIKTAFGKDHDFVNIHSYQDFKKRVPIRDYEGLKHYIDRIIDGERDVLWPGLPLYFCKTSGTTSGAKYIPLTKDSMPNHINSAKNALLHYIVDSGNSFFVDGKMIFLQGSPVLNMKGKIPVGRLSGIVANYVPKYLQKNRLPSYETNCIEDWETKVDAIVKETINQDMRLISGIPSWVQMYFEKLIKYSGKENVQQIFPNFSLFVYGGVNFEPYREQFEKLIGKKVDSIELFPASEGFIAYQDVQGERGLLLVLNSGIFYEFIEASTFNDENPIRISLAEVQLDVNYVLIINNNAGLWGYNIGDTIQFVSKDPYRIIVTGRLKHFISSFGEHVIGKEVELAIVKAQELFSAKVVEFTVAPQVNPKNGLPYHQWYIEFGEEPSDLEGFINALDLELQSQNSYYFDLIQGNILQELKISRIQKNGFNLFMKSIGKLGGQNKVARLSNDRRIANKLDKFKIKD
jgi:hypothetical protein